MDGDHGGGIPLQQGAVVERKADLSENRQVGLQEQHAPLVDVVHTSFDQCDGIGYPFLFDGCQKPQPPQVDPHDGYVAVADMGRCAQDSTIAAKGDEKIELLHTKIQVTFEYADIAFEMDLIFQLLQVRGVDVGIDPFLVERIEEVLDVWDIFILEYFAVDDYLNS